MFAKEKLINEIELTISPIIFGTGLGIFFGKHGIKSLPPFPRGDRRTYPSYEVFCFKINRQKDIF
ncbi:hypothetical protein HC823_01275 [Candidatus Gracilibacteria bacterium]|nr:hypothetical protein [Candidatus Gracilibacteria bacterium]